MKRLLLTFAMLIALQNAFAQFTKGTFLLGGKSSFDFSSLNSTYDGEDVSQSTSFSLSPQFGYFVADGLVLGLSLEYTYSKDKDELFDETATSRQLAFGPVVRYYSEGGVFGEFALAIGSGEMEIAGETFDTSSFGWGLGVGYAAMISDQVAIEPMLSYASVATDIDLDEKMKTGGLIFGVGVSVFIGGE